MSNESSYDIGILSDQKEAELRAAITAYCTVEQEILKLSRSIIELQMKKKDLEVIKSKAGQNKALISSTLRELKSKYFSARNAGL